MKIFTVPRVAAALVASGAIIVGAAMISDAAGGTGCATLTYPLCARSVSKSQVVDHSLDEQELAPSVLAKLNAPDQVDQDVNGTSTLKAVYNDKLIESIGGTFLDHKTPLGSFTLPAGTWVINSSVQFQRVVASKVAVPVRPQFGIRAFHTDANKFGLNFGTVMPDIAPYVGADAFGSDSHRVQLTETTTFTVSAFGYQDDRGGQDSGTIKVVDATIFVQQG